MAEHVPFAALLGPPVSNRLDIGVCAQIACLLEAAARKAGNVHPAREFAGLRYADFLLSAAAIGPVLQQAPERPVGETILQAVRATRRVVTTNTNLGIILLIAPLAAVPSEKSVEEGLSTVLNGLTVEDSRLTYEAIRLAAAGGLGEVAEEDVSRAPTRPLRDVMALAAERDLLARQYANGFREILHDGVPFLCNAWTRVEWEAAIQWTHLHLLATYPDSLIARKRGLDEARAASRRASAVLEAGFPHAGHAQFAELDAWLRAEGNARNPGTSADLVTACLFVALRQSGASMLVRGAAG